MANSSPENVHQVIIIGSGPAGLTAGIYTGRARLQPLIIDGSKPGGQLMGTTRVENWPGEVSIMGPELMRKMRDQAQVCGAAFMAANVTGVDLSARPFRLWTSNGQELSTQSLIIATGASPNILGCPGEQEYWGKGVATCAVCDGAFYADRHVVIVGGGDTAMEDASFMAKITKHVTVVHIQEALTASKPMQERVLANPDVTVIYNSTVTEVRGNGSHITQVVITNQKTGAKTTLPADIMFLAIGNKPNTDIFAGQLELGKYGYINVHDHTKTSVPGVFVAGDVADYRYRQAITSAGSGCMAALDAERYLAGLNEDG